MTLADIQVDVPEFACLRVIRLWVGYRGSDRNTCNHSEPRSARPSGGRLRVVFLTLWRNLRMTSGPQDDVTQAPAQRGGRALHGGPMGLDSTRGRSHRHPFLQAKPL
ncbi:hypothetical protein D3P04_20550 [Paracoccus onubensis]|uniref:Uncharacterized protein n=1 Tax=Paracoccus onubensis TaxID=1675788 RepID=A0A418SMY0_9RHOB|nr:hypothetical protein D3P04_20550 [Paracoccus onubensis]